MLFILSELWGKHGRRTGAYDLKATIITINRKGTSMSYGTFCRICHRLMVPSREQICGECQDAMKRAGYVKVVHCEE